MLCFCSPLCLFMSLAVLKCPVSLHCSFTVIRVILGRSYLETGVGLFSSSVVTVAPAGLSHGHDSLLCMGNRELSHSVYTGEEQGENSSWYVSAIQKGYN